MAGMSSFTPTPSNKNSTNNTVLLVTVPNSGSLRHFFDRRMRVVARADTFQATHIVTGREGMSSVRSVVITRPCSR
jgi:hypothetical protein